MSDRIAKLTNILSYILFALAVVFGAAFYYTVVTSEPVPEYITIPAEKTAFMMKELGSSLNNFTIVVYILLGLAAISSVLFSFVNIFKSKRTAVRSLISIAILGGVILVAYVLASPEIPKFLGAEKFDITATSSRMVGTGLFSMYLFFVLAVFGILYTEIRGAFK